MSGFNWLLPLIPQPEVPKAAAGGGGASSQPRDITTTIPAGAVANADGSYTIATINGVRVNVRRDDVVDKLGAAARTDSDFKWTTPGFRFSGNRVTAVIPAQLSLGIQTHYDKGVSPASPSAYGRGTTPDDIKNGNTSLQFHESCHGAAFQEFLQQNPPPQFQGRVGMTIEQFKQARSDYADRLAEYGEKLNKYSEQQVDYPTGGTPKPSPSPTPSPAPAPGSATP